MLLIKYIITSDFVKDLTDLDLYNLTKKLKKFKACIKFKNTNEKYLYDKDVKTDILNPWYDKKTYTIDNKNFELHKRNKVYMFINDPERKLNYSSVLELEFEKSYIFKCGTQYHGIDKSYKDYIDKLIPIKKKWKVICVITCNDDNISIKDIVTENAIKNKELFKLTQRGDIIYKPDNILYEFTADNSIFINNKKGISIFYNHLWKY